MSKISFNKLGLSKASNIKEVEFNEQKIEISQYLDIGLKSTLVNAAVRYSVIKGIVDEILVDAYLHMFIIEHYTNITFTPKQKENILDTFDILESSGFLDLIVANMNQSEYDYLFSMAKKLIVNLNEYNKTIVSLADGTEAMLEKFLEKVSGQTK